MDALTIAVPRATWTEVSSYLSEGDTLYAAMGSICHVTGDSIIVYVQSDEAPEGFSTSTPKLTDTVRHQSFTYWGLGDSKVWAYAPDADCSVSNSPGVLS